MIRRILCAVFAALLSSHALAYDATKANRYPSMDLFRPEMDRLTIHGPGSTGDASTLSSTLPFTGAVPLPLREMMRGRYDVRAFQAKGDGVNDDTAAIRAAFLACNAAGGGAVFFPPTGKAYRIVSGITVAGNACGAEGIGTPNWPGPNGTEAQWTASGSWIKCEDTANVCIKFTGTGFVRGLNVWHNQPTPSATPGTPWTPIAYPYTFSFGQNFSFAEKINDVNGTNGIIFDYPQNASIAGTYSYVNDFFCGSYNTCLKFSNVNDTMSVHNFHQRRLWYIGNSNATDYFMAHSIGMDIGYLDAGQFTNVEFYESWKAIYLHNGIQVYGNGTLSTACSYCQFTNIFFNQVVQAVDIEFGGDFTAGSSQINGTQATLKFTNVTGQTDTDYNRAAQWMFNFGSDRFDVQMSDVWFSFVGNSVFNLGAGKGSRLTLSNFRTGTYLPASYGGFGAAALGYDGLGTGKPAIVLNKGAILSIQGGLQEINGTSTAGPRIACGTPINGVAGSNCGITLSPVNPTTPTAP